MIPRARWHRIQSLFEQFADLDTPDRGARLAQACGDDADLRQSVESLLALDQSRKDPLVHVIGAAAESLLEEHRDRLIGTRVGSYRVVSILGHGGMSTVYRGEREDAHHQRTVAIKVLQHASLHPRLRSRLHSERHILATLDHPSIARLIDSGDLEDGTPYLVMDYVAGDSIDAYCDSRTMFVRERVELFIEVCSAVQYAHRNLVVHRDLKASNIFVTDEGAPKLLDFGIAKLLAPESLSHTLPVTRLQERILTPENAAPEQVLGRPITTATDIYALGVLLYQLLTGRSPYRLSSYSQLQLERAICMDEPPKPSQVVVAKVKDESEADRNRIAELRGLAPQRLRSRLSGDLDAIVSMAMRKEPDRRYASVEAMADDLQRHLRGQPVRAKQGDWRYNTGKFLRRNLVGAMAVAGLFVTLTFVAAVTLWQNHRISQARDATAQERDRAQQVSAFLVDVFSQADPFRAQGHNTTAKELLDRGAEQILTKSGLQPEVRAQLLESIALAYRHSGLNNSAIPLFEQALAIRREQRPPDSRSIAAALANLAQALTYAGHLVSAEAYLQQAVSASQSSDEPRSAETADILVQYGNFALNGKSDPVMAKKMFSDALGMYRSLPGDQHLAIAGALSGIASAAVWSGDYLTGEQYQRDALNVLRATVSRNYPDHAVALAALGYILTQRGKLVEAEETLNEALEIERVVFGASHQRIASVEADLGQLYAREGDAARGIASVTDAVRIATEQLGSEHYMTGYYIDQLASLYLQAGNLAAAENAARKALGIYAQAGLPARHLYVASSKQVLGEVLLRQGHAEQAQSEEREALEIDAALTGSDNWRSLRTAASLGWVLIHAGKADEGEPILVAAQKKLVATLGAKHPESQLATSRLMDYYRERHRDAAADQLLKAGDSHGI